MQCKVSWQGDMAFATESGSGHKILVDGPPESGGKNAGPRPMELLLMGMGACSSVDVISILKKSRTPVAHCEVEITAERADEAPKVFTGIHLHFVVSGQNLKEKQVERAISLSAEKYCSASIMLAKTAKVSHDFEIVEA